MDTAVAHQPDEVQAPAEILRAPDDAAKDVIVP
jgi:hypothetical protein